MEKITSFIIKRVAMMLLAVLITSTAWAAVGDIVGYGYCGGDEGDITRPQYILTENDEGGLTLTIRGSGAMRNYTSSLAARPWHSYSERITKVLVYDGITEIGGKAFKCSNLREAIISSTVTKIGDYAFESDDNLETVIALSTSTSVVDVSRSAFSSVPSTCTLYIENDSYWNRTGNMTIKNFQRQLPSNDATFLYFRDSDTNNGRMWVVPCGYSGAMADYTTPEARGWASEVYYACREVIIWPEVTTIGKNAFYNFRGLQVINIPDAMTSIGENAFYGCLSLPSISLPDGLTNIGKAAFSGCTNLGSINIPDNVTIINDETFYGCSNLTTISIPSSVTSLGSGAFEGCSNLTSISIPSNVVNIGSRAFYGCSRLSVINIPASIIAINDETFYGCSGLTRINLPNSVTSIGNSAFQYCSNLTNLYYEGSQAQWYAVTKGTNWKSNVPSSFKEHWRCNVTFDANGHGAAPSVQTNLWSNEAKVTKPSDPTCEGCEFQGWHTDAAGTTPWDFANDIVPGNMTLYAKWKITNIALADNSPYNYTGDFQVDFVSYTRTLSSSFVGKHLPWFVPFDYTLTAEDLQKFNFYKINMIANSPSPDVEASNQIWVFITRIDAGTVLHANMPYVFKPLEAASSLASYTFASTNATLKAKDTGVILKTETAEDIYSFYGTYENTKPAASDPFYYISGSGISLADNGNITIGPYRWIVRKTNKYGDSTSYVHEMKFLDGEEDDATSLNEELRKKNEDLSGSWYSLDGLKLLGKPAQKGIYIHNGKKEAIR